MNKEEAVIFLLEKIYSSNSNTIISKNEIKQIEQFYINNHTRFSDVEEFCAADDNISNLVNRLKSGKDEINKQLKRSLALQPAILSECVFIQTLAKILGLRSYLDLESTPFSLVPNELLPFVHNSTDTISSARYVYFNRSDYSTFIFQYGNPKERDASAIIYSNDVLIEIKDMPALILDKDLLYDDNGYLCVSDYIRDEVPEFSAFIDKFNSETTVFDKLGSNYSLFSENDSVQLRSELVQRLFDSNNLHIDIVLTATGSNELIAIRSNDMGYIFSDGTPLIDTSGSEIRTTGKNARTSPFTPAFLERVLSEYDVFCENGICTVLNSNDKVIGKTAGRGKPKNEYTRFKINQCFFVKKCDLTENENGVSFLKSKINQSKSGIALHVNILKSKEEIKRTLYNF